MQSLFAGHGMIDVFLVSSRLSCFRFDMLLVQVSLVKAWRAPPCQAPPHSPAEARSVSVSLVRDRERSCLFVRQFVRARCFVEAWAMSGPPEGWHPKVGDVLENRWAIVKKLGQGAFGAVYEVHDQNNSSNAGACKVSRYLFRHHPHAESNIAFLFQVEHQMAMVHVLKWEVLVMKKLTDAGAKHSTLFLDCGRSPRGDYAFLCMTMVGQNLEKLREKLPPTAGQRFSLRTVLHIAIETLLGLKELHDCG